MKVTLEMTSSVSTSQRSSQYDNSLEGLKKKKMLGGWGEKGRISRDFDINGLQRRYSNLQPVLRITDLVESFILKRE